MQKRFTLIFDEVMREQLTKLAETDSLRILLSKLFDRMESLGPRAGKLVDSQLFLYEMKAKSPPLRLYYRHVKETDELWVFEYEMKTSEKKQKKTIGKLKFKIQGQRE
ncbi:hypothetical protein J4211_03785 [Candidatus Woesearchaeota archaeon]|nr:hypothetical protein [Candidatus Woesearchaeota archaeon]